MKLALNFNHPSMTVSTHYLCCLPGGLNTDKVYSKQELDLSKQAISEYKDRPNQNAKNKNMQVGKNSLHLYRNILFIEAGAICLLRQC